MSDKPEDESFDIKSLDIFGTDNPTHGITSVSTSFSPPGPLQADIIFEDELRMIWRSCGFTHKQINEMLKEARKSEEKAKVNVNNLTRTAAGPFDPNRPWLDQVLDSCSLDSSDNNCKRK